MKKFLKKATIAHKENDYLPHLFKEIGLIAVFVLTIALFGASKILRDITTSNFSLSAIYPSVIVALTNEDRAAESVPELKTSPLLEAAAQAKAEDMLSNGYFAHISPTGVSPWYWIKQAGYQYHFAGENLAINFSDSGDVTDAWMKSPTHRANLLNAKFTEVGVATIKGTVAGREVIFVVQMFGSPKTNFVSPSFTAAKLFELASLTGTSSVATTSTSSASLSKATSTPVVATTSTSTASTTNTLAIKTVASSSVLGISTTSEDTPVVATGPTGVSVPLAVFFQPNKLLRISLMVLLLIVTILFVIFLKHAQNHKIKHTYYGLLIIFWIILCAFLAHIFASPTVLL